MCSPLRYPVRMILIVPSAKTPGGHRTRTLYAGISVGRRFKGFLEVPTTVCLQVTTFVRFLCFLLTEKWTERPPNKSFTEPKMRVLLTKACLARPVFVILNFFNAMPVLPPKHRFSVSFSSTMLIEHLLVCGVSNVTRFSEGCCEESAHDWSVVWCCSLLYY